MPSNTVNSYLYPNGINSRKIPKSVFKQINGLTLHALHWEMQHAPKVVLLHGWMDCAASFQFVIDALHHQYDIYALDWRGCGLSEHQASGYYDRAIMLNDLFCWLELISPDKPVHLLGHSMGGMLAAHFAACFPKKITSLVIAEGFGIKDEAIELAYKRTIRFIQSQVHHKTWHSLESIDKVVEKLRHRNPLLTESRALFLAQSLTFTNEQDQLIYRADIKHNIPQPNPYQLNVAMTIWQQITAPTLWIEGGDKQHNHYLKQIKQTINERYQAFGCPKKIILKKSGHMLQWEEPEVFAAAIDQFWQDYK